MKSLLAMLLMIGGTACAQQTIQVSGDAEIKVVPDRAVLFLGVEVRTKTLDEARRENDRRVRAIRAAAAKAGVADGDIQTDYVQLGMTYFPDGITPDVFYSRKSLIIVVRDMQRVEEALAGALNAGATHVHNVEFETTKLREHRDHARTLAVQAASEKARDMAAAAGMKVTGATSITSANYGAQSWYGSGWGGGGRSMMAQSQNVVMAGGGGSGSSGVSAGAVALGRISVTASVSMTFRMQ